MDLILTPVDQDCRVDAKRTEYGRRFFTIVDLEDEVPRAPRSSVPFKSNRKGKGSFVPEQMIGATTSCNTSEPRGP
jgi:predicted Fe-Mo cluster-binding NifX family protein